MKLPPLSIRWAAHVNASCFSPTISSKLQRCSSSSFVGPERSKAAILVYTHPGCTRPSAVIRLFGLSTPSFLPTSASWRQPDRCWDLLGILLGVPRTKADCLVGSWRLVCTCVRGRFVAWCAAESSVILDLKGILLVMCSAEAAFRPTVDVSSCRKLHSISVEGLHHCYIGPKLRVQGRHMVALTRCLCETAARKA